MKNSMKEKGQGLVEYAMIIVLVGVVTIGVLTLLGPKIGNIFSKVNSGMVGSIPVTGGGGGGGLGYQGLGYDTRTNCNTGNPNYPAISCHIGHNDIFYYFEGPYNAEATCEAIFGHNNCEQKNGGTWNGKYFLD